MDATLCFWAFETYMFGGLIQNLKNLKYNQSRISKSGVIYQANKEENLVFKGNYYIAWI